MLIYHPAFDAYHCVFRMLIIADHVGTTEVDKARMLDFYLAFPSALTNVTWPAEFRSARKAALAVYNPYRSPVSDRSTMRDMRAMQDAALRCLAAAELIEPDALEVGNLVRTDREIPGALRSSISEHVLHLGVVADLVLQTLGAIPLLGSDGLKSRTSLMDHRYDLA